MGINFPFKNTSGHEIIKVGEEVYITIDDDTQFLGILKQRADGRAIFIRPNLVDDKHLFRKDKSYALDTTLLKNLVMVNSVLFFETDSGSYYAAADYMLEKGTVRQFTGYNEQVFLERALFSKSMP